MPPTRTTRRALSLALLTACNGGGTTTDGATDTTGTSTTGTTEGTTSTTDVIPTTGGTTGTTDPSGTSDTDAPPGCAPPPLDLVACDDYTEPGHDAWSYTVEDGAATSIAPVDGVVAGTRAIEIATETGFLLRARLDLAAPIDVTAHDTVQLAVRAKNDNDGGWQIAGPVLTLEDSKGARATLSPTSNLLPTDGLDFRLVQAPLAGGPGWQLSGDPIDLSSLAAIELEADTWSAGFNLVIDALSFKTAGTWCEVACPNNCGGGTCDATRPGCACPLGATGPDCSTCTPGYAWDGRRCALQNDAEHDVWPNPTSRTNGDPWLVEHHDDLQRLEPRLLVLHYVNAQDPADNVVPRVIDGFREGSRPKGHQDPGAPPQLEYQIARTVDLRDGVLGRPPPPADWKYDNSTLYPRVMQDGQLYFDYAALFTPEYAVHYGYPDPDQPGEFLTLCELIDSGEINEVWFVGSGDVAGDGAAYEVLEFKQRYTADRVPIAGSFDPCAGNGCWPQPISPCARSVRVGFVNYNRGPGCYLHSQGHGMESLANTQAIPAFSAYFRRFAALDLDARFALPFASAYGVACDQDSTCITYPDPAAADFHHQGQLLPVSPYDAACGNVHFPPNGRSHYDYAGPDVVLSTCAGFGEHGVACGADAPADVGTSLWSAYEDQHGDCGGGFLVWWYQNMPAHGTGKSFADGRPMLSVWPFLFY